MASIIKVDQIETDVNLTGSASAPSLYPMNDTNTGVFFPAADTVAISTGGTERLRVNSSGNLVVTGTTSLSNVTVSGTVTGTYTLGGTPTIASPTITGTTSFPDGSASAPSIFRASDTNTGVFFPAADTLAASTGGSERMRIDSSGNFQFNSGYGSVATAFGCRAWVNFNGQGTVAIRASGNVSSITDNGEGTYTVNLSTAMPDTNYCGLYTPGNGNEATFYTGLDIISSSAAKVINFNGSARVDALFNCVAFFR